MKTPKKINIFTAKAKETIQNGSVNKTLTPAAQNLDNIFEVKDLRKILNSKSSFNFFDKTKAQNTSSGSIFGEKKTENSLKLCGQEVMEEVYKAQEEMSKEEKDVKKEPVDEEKAADETEEATKISNSKVLEDLNKKYDLGIDFSEELTDRQLELLQAAYFVDEQAKTLEATKGNMLEYFETLGVVDSAYDGIKDLLGVGLSKGDIEKYYEDEKTKNDILISIIKSGGTLSLDEATKTKLEALGKNVSNKDSLTFEEAYKLLRGVDFDPDIISATMAAKDAYTLAVTEQQNAVAIEHAMKNSSPQEIYECFCKIAQNRSDITGEELFNNYYKSFFEEHPEEMEILYGDALKCIGISVKDGYIYQEVGTTDGEPIGEDEIESHFLLSETDENGVVHYYRTLSLDGTHILCDNNGKNYSPELITHNRNYFKQINEKIQEQGLYLDKVRKEYDEEFGDGAFDNILEEYPKMYTEAFGENIFADKLNEYEKDMDSYTRNLSQVLSIGCFAASFIPGVNMACWIPLLAAGSDNILDLANLVTNNKANEYDELGEWIKNTLLEAGMIAIGMGINRFSQNMGNRFVADKIAKGSSFVMEHARGVEALVEYGIDNAASVVWDMARGIADGSLINGDGSFNWEYFGKMVATDLVFNSADLRSGMAFYRAIASDGIDLGNGVKFTIDSETGKVKFTYENGMEFEIDKYESTAIIYDDASHETGISVIFNKETNSWQTFDGEEAEIDLMSPDSIAKTLEHEPYEPIDKVNPDDDFEPTDPDGTKPIDDNDENDIKTEPIDNPDEIGTEKTEPIDSPDETDTENPKRIDDPDETDPDADNVFDDGYNSNKTPKDISDDIRYQGKTKDIVDEMFENDSVKEAVSNGFLDKEYVYELAEAGQDAVNNAIKLLENEQIQEYINKGSIQSGGFIDCAKDANFDQIMEIISTPRIDELILKNKLGFIDILDVSEAGSDALANLNRIINGVDSDFDETSTKIFNLVYSGKVGSNYLCEMASSPRLLELAQSNPDVYKNALDILSNETFANLIIKNPVATVDKIVDVASDPKTLKILQETSNDDLKRIFELGKTENLSTFDKSKYDLINLLLHGKRIDDSLEDYSIKVNGKEVSIKFDNDAVSAKYLKEHPELKIDANNKKVITDDVIKSIEDAISKMAESGEKVPKEIYITDLFAPDARLDGQKAAGGFNRVNPDSIYINSNANSINDLEYLRMSVEHEIGHMRDFLPNNEKFVSEDSNIKISKDNKSFNYDGLTNNDIERLLGDYALTNNKEFVAEVSVMLAEGTIVYNKATGQYEILTDSYTNPRCDKVKLKAGDQKKINLIMEIYNKMTNGHNTKAKEV